MFLGGVERSERRARGPDGGGLGVHGGRTGLLLWWVRAEIMASRLRQARIEMLDDSITRDDADG